MTTNHIRDAKAKFYAKGHFDGSFKTEQIWNLLKPLRIEDRPPYTQHLCDLGGIFENKPGGQALRDRERCMHLLLEALADRSLRGRVSFDLRNPWTEAFKSMPGVASGFLDCLLSRNPETLFVFLTRVIVPDRHPGFITAINICANRTEIIAAAIGTPYIDLLNKVYRWPELIEHVSESGLTGMLEHDLGL